MDYNYIRLEKQIKQLMNKSYVASSSHAKSAEEIINGSLRIYVDTVSKCFGFRLTGTTFNPLYIDPANRALLNVQYINNVDISKLIGGVLEGYGITIVDKGKGVYEINVTKDMFALKEELTEIDDKFDNYTTTEDLMANYLQLNPTNYSQTVNSALVLKPNFDSTNTFMMLLQALNPNMEASNFTSLVVGKSLTVDESAYLWYKDPGVGGLGIRGTTEVISFSNSYINLNKQTTVSGKFTVNPASDVNVINASLNENSVLRIAVGKTLSTNQCSYLGYKEPGIGYLGLFGKALIITWTNDLICLEESTKIIGDLTITGKIENYYTSADIDNNYYTKIASDNRFPNIENFKVPVEMPLNYEFVKSKSNMGYTLYAFWYDMNPSAANTPIKCKLYFKYIINDQPSETSLYIKYEGLVPSSGSTYIWKTGEKKGELEFDSGTWENGKSWAEIFEIRGYYINITKNSTDIAATQSIMFDEGNPGNYIKSVSEDYMYSPQLIAECDNKYALKSDLDNISSGGLFTLTNQRFSDEELAKNGWELEFDEQSEVNPDLGWKFNYSTGQIQLEYINRISGTRSHILLYIEIATIEIKPFEHILIINGVVESINKSNIKIYEELDENDLVDYPWSTSCSMKLNIPQSKFIAASNVKYKIFTDRFYTSIYYTTNVLSKLNNIIPGANYYTTNDCDDKIYIKD